MTDARPEPDPGPLRAEIEQAIPCRCDECRDELGQVPYFVAAADAIMPIVERHLVTAEAKGAADLPTEWGYRLDAEHAIMSCGVEADSEQWAREGAARFGLREPLEVVSRRVTDWQVSK